MLSSLALGLGAFVLNQLRQTFNKFRFFPLAISAMSAFERWIEVMETSKFVEVLKSLEAYLTTTDDLDETNEDEKMESLARSMQVCMNSYLAFR